ncbi:hypothetical protein ACQ4M4_26500 [Leptolyngbya sp. AN02str]|uniref:hypothetical protein n=1 Tax=Leptolyngbya sp. AN02str TaxID=3423363 RepID=UPI003D31BB84
MLNPTWANDTPIVVVCNTAEAYTSFFDPLLDRTIQAQSIFQVHTSSDRALFWLRSAKLVIGSLPLHHLAEVNQRWGYGHTQYCYPSTATPSLCRDILDTPELLQTIVSYAGESRAIQLIPYANTATFYELVNRLQAAGLTVYLPESPDLGNRWLRDALDTKLGFRSLLAQCLPEGAEHMPLGFGAVSIHQTAEIVSWFLQRARACIVKTNEGVLGWGQLVFQPGAVRSPADILTLLQSQPLLNHTSLVIEAYIDSPQHLFPSAEFFVPAPTVGLPYLTYVSNQLFCHGQFAGVLMSPDLAEQPWYNRLVTQGLHLAKALQAMGYVGHFDLDGLVDEAGRLYLLEVNPRRTGATHVHELACHLLGADYAAHHTLISQTAIATVHHTYSALVQKLQPVLYPRHGKPEGVIITHTSNLASGQFGYVAIAPTLIEARSLQQYISTNL